MYFPQNFHNDYTVTAPKIGIIYLVFIESGIGKYVSYSIIKKKLTFILRRSRSTRSCRADDDNDDDLYFVYEKVLEFEITLVGYVMLCSFVELYPSGGEGYS
jgi:guanylate kinase